MNVDHIEIYTHETYNTVRKGQKFRKGRVTEVKIQSNIILALIWCLLYKNLSLVPADKALITIFALRLLERNTGRLKLAL